MAVDKLQANLSADELLQSGGGDAVVLDAASGAENLVVPGGTMLLVADFSREGPDLLIEGPNGEEVVVQDYFTLENPPALQTSGGAQLTSDLVSRLAGSATSNQVAAAGGPAAEAQPIGTVQSAAGEVTAIRADGSRVTLNQGDPVYQGDVVETTGDGAVGITFIDDTTFSLGEGGRMVLDELIYDSETNEGTSAISVVQGVFSFVSGAIAKSGPDAMTIRTPVATIGIRGTKVAVKAGAEGEENVITLLEEDGGITGEIVVTNSAGSEILNVANQTTTISSFFTPPSAPVVLPEAQINQMFGSTVDALPEHNAGTGSNDRDEQGRRDDAESRGGEEAVAEGEGEEEEGEEEGEGEEEAVAEGEGEEEGEEEEAEEEGEGEEEAVAEAEAGDEGEDEAVAEAAAEGGEEEAVAEAVAEAEGGEEEAVAEAAAEGGEEEAVAEAGGAEDDAGDEGDAELEADAVAEAEGTNTTDEAAAEALVSGADAEDVELAKSGAEIAREAALAEGLTEEEADAAAEEAFTQLVSGEASVDDLIETAAGGPDPDEVTFNFGDTQPSFDFDDVPVFGTGPEPDQDPFAGLESVETAAVDEVIGDDLPPDVDDERVEEVDVEEAVEATAEAATVAADDVTGAEDKAIALDISAETADGSDDTISEITISGVPDGATLSAGTDNGDGTWTLTAEQLDGLTITPAAEDSADFSLSIAVTTIDPDGGEPTTTESSFDVTVTGVADAAEVDVADASGLEDTAIALDISAAPANAGETISDVTISGVPDGATLSAGTDNGDGSWTLTTDQLDGLTVTPAENDPSDFSLSVTVTSSEDGTTATSTASFDVDVTGVLDAPTVTVADASGTEDTAIALDISALVDDSAAAITEITISGVPTGATLSAGTDNGDGSWTLTADQLSDLTVTPATDDSTDFDLNISVTSTEDGASATATADFSVTVSGVGDAPTMTVADAAGDEDTAIALDLSTAVSDASETITDVTISGVPTGASLSAGTDNGDGSWTLTADQLSGLTITPAADDSSNFTLSVTATSLDADSGVDATADGDGSSAQTTLSFDVAVTGVADTPTVTIADTVGAEDTAIALDVTAGLGDADGSEVLLVRIEGVPEGAELSAGTDMGNGQWSISPADLEGLTITPPADSDADFDLTVVATSLEEGSTSSTTSSFSVSVTGVADAPTVTVADVTGAEDATISLDISAGLSDTDGSEVMTVAVSGVPDGSVLTAGTDDAGNPIELTVVNGVAIVPPGDISSLTITPPADDSNDFTLTVTATSSEDGTSATTTQSFGVTVTGVADVPTVTVADVSGAEDTAIALEISAVVADTSDTISDVTISGVPTGASLSAGTDNGDGTWTLTADQLTGLTVTPATDDATDFTLGVSVTSSEDGTTATSTASFDVTVSGVADAPAVTVADASGAEDTAITLDISAAVADASETITDVTISGVPTGATLSAGTDNGDGTWTLTADQLTGLTVTPATDDATDFTLGVSVTSSEDGTTATSTASFDVTVTGVADAPTVTVADVSGAEDTAITLDISAAVADTSETISDITISGVPTGATLSAGTDNGDGTWTLTADQLTGLTVTPATDDATDFTLGVSVTSSEDGTTATSTASFDVAVSGVADAPTVTVADASGAEDTAITLDISAAVTDASETITDVTISGVPTGATLSAGTDNGDGTWTLTADQLTNLTVTPAADDDADFTLGVSVTSSEDGTTATSTASFDVTVSGVADAPTVTVADVSGAEDTVITLDISAAVADASETITDVTISGVPTGATLSAGTDNGDGTWTLTADQLTNLTVTPATDDATDFTLGVSVTSSEDGTTATSTASFDVTVTGVADDPTVTVADATGAEDTAITLDISAAVADASETITDVTISGVPTGATLSAGTDNGDGTWTLTADQLTGLTVTPATDDATDFTLGVSVTSSEDGTTATSTASFDVTVTGVADAPTVTVADVTGAEDTVIPLDISAAVTDTTEVISDITVSGVPTGATLSAGTDNGDGTWTLTTDQLSGLTLTPAANDTSDFTLTVTATSSEEGTTATTSASFDVTVTGVADEPIVTVTDATGAEDTAIALDITATLADGTTGTPVTSMFLLDEGSDNVLRIGADGTVDVIVSESDIEALTGLTHADLDNRGIEVDDAGNIFFTDKTSGSVIMKPADGGELQTVMSEAQITAVTDGNQAADPKSLTIGADGKVYVMDDQSNSIVSYDPANGSVTLVASSDDLEAAGGITAIDLKGDIVTGADGTLYFMTNGAPDAVMSIDPATGVVDVVASGTPFNDLDVFMTVAPNGDLIVADDSGSNTIHRVDVGDGTVSTFLSEAQMEAVVGGEISLEGGIGFDPDGNFFVAEENTDTVYSWSVDDPDEGTIDLNSGGVFVTQADIDAATGEAADLEAGMAFGFDAASDADSLEIVISGVPDGASLSAGTDNGDGSWTLTASQLEGLTITPPEDDASDFTLTVTATSTDVAGGTATSTRTMEVDVTGVADTPTVTVTDVSGAEDTAIVLDISAAVTDLDGSEVLSIEISGVPDGATLSSGTDNGDGTWTLTADQLTGLTVTPAADDDTDFTLGVAVTSSEDGTTATSSASFDVTVSGVADAPTVTVADASGAEDTAITLDISAAVADASETITDVTISGVPTGASLSAGTDNGDGTWTLTADQLTGLTVTPATDDDTDFTLGVSVTSSEDGTTATSTASFDVTVSGVADAPTVTVADVSGAEDTAITLDISAAVADASETITDVTISGVPTGASLSAGTDNGDGTWTLTGDQLTGLTVTPATDDDTDFTLGVSVTSSEDGTTATSTASFDVTVSGVADAPTVTVADVSGAEDTAIALDISAAVADASETITDVTISGVPTGATLSAGTDNGDGTWTLTADQLTGLAITPAADDDADFSLGIAVTSSEGGTTATSTASFDVTVSGVADAPTVTVADASGAEDTAITLDISAAVTDASETITDVTISGVPTGASLSAGTDNGDGTWTLTADQLTGLTVTPAADDDTDFTLGVSVTSSEDGTTATTTDSFDVTVSGVADAPTVTVADVSGAEDTAIALDISAAVADASETITDVTISGVPTGASLSAGTDNGDGTWTLTADQLTGLAITPAADDDADFSLGIAVTSSEDGTTATSTANFDVTVSGVADAPTVTAADVSGAEDTAIALDISAAVTDASETITDVTISGVPTGASLSAGTDNGDGTWTLTADQLTGLTVTPAADDDTDFTLGVSVTSSEDGTTATTTDSFDVTVSGVADAPTVTVADVGGAEDTAIALDISAAVADASETITDVTISGVPTGAALSAGTDNGDGTWTLTADQLNGLTVTPAADDSTDFTLGVSVTSSEDGTTATTTDSFDVTVSGVADAPTVTVADVSGAEDTAITLDISAAVADASDTISDITISGVPSGAALSAGTDNGDGTWTLTADQLTGLAITPAADDDADFSLGVSVTSSEDGTTATTTASFDVTVSGVADAPTVSVADVTGAEDTAITLDISAAVTDASETITDVTISGVPTGAALSAGTDNGDGTWTLTADQLTNLTVTPATDDSTDFTLGVAVTSSEDGTTATSTASFDVAVTGVADAPTVTVADVSGAEDTAIALDISAAVADASDTITDVTISGVPTGASLSAGTDNGDGTWTLTTDQLTGLTVTPATDDDTDFTLGVSVTSSEDGTTATTTDSFDVTVTGVADAPTVTVADASGAEDTAITLDISAAVTDASETITDVTISGVPTGATLSAGTDNGDGTWTLTADQLTGLTVTPAADDDTDFTLGISVTSSEDGTTATSTASFDVTVSGVADAPTVTVADVSGAEDTAIALDISAAVADASENITDVTISGVPTGASLSAGTDNGDGTWTLTADQLTGLAITPADDDDADFTLGVSVTSSEDGTTATSTASFDVTVSGVADVPTVTVADVTGEQDTAITLDISAVVSDASETITDVTISGVPTGATLSAGTNNGDGTWTLTQGQLDGLTITPPEGDDADFSLTVVATSSEDGTTATTSASFDVTVTADESGDPIVTVTDVTGTEDTAIALDIAATLADGTTGSAETSMFLMDEGSDSILKIGADGSVEVVVSQADIMAATGLSDADMDDRGIEIDDAGNIFFTEKDSDSILMKPADGGDLQVVVTRSQIASVTGTSSSHADPKSLTIGADGNVYIMDDTSDSIISYDPSDGSVSLLVDENALEALSGISAVDLKGDIVTSPDGTLYVLSNGNPNAIMAIDPVTGDPSIIASGTPFIDLDVFMTVAPNGDLIIADDSGANTIYRVDTSNGDVDVFLTEQQIEDAVGQSIDLEGGISFDADGNFYIAEENSDGVFVWTADDAAAGTIDVDSGAEFVSQSDIMAVTGVDTDLEAGMTFGSYGAGDALEIVISGVPDGAELSGGTDNGDGTWTLTTGDLEGLTITPAADDDSDFTLTVTASTVDENGDTLTTVKTLDVEVTGVADVPTVTVSDAEGDEDTAISLDVSAALTDTDGSEALAITIDGVPADAELSAGTDNGDGSWTLTSAQLDGLTITPAPGDDSDFDLTVTATASEDGTTASSSGTITVVVNEGVSTVATPYDDVITGTDGADNIDALSGNDFVYGEGGDDILDGGAGSDYLSGGEGDDELIYSEDGTWSSSWAAQNTETGETVNLDGMNASLDVFDGGAGNDVVSLTVGDDAIFLDDRYSVFPDGEGPRIANIETINAGAGNDIVDLTSDIYGYGDVTLNGEAGNDTLWAGAGDDVLDGGSGDDNLFGGAGDDVLSGGTGSNTLDGGDGIDTADYSAVGVAMDIDLRDDEALSIGDSSVSDDLSNIENVVGTSLDDTIRGDSGANTLWGGDGDDTLKGGSGADILYGGDGDDTLKGGSGADILYGGAGDDTLEGGRGDDYIYGGDRNDTISGGSGDDIIVGGAGDDTMSGGKGDDTFQFESLDDLGNNTITDFDGGHDMLAFDGDAFVVDHDATSGAIDSSEFEIIDSSAGEAASGNAAFVFDSATEDLFFDVSGAGSGYTLVANIEDGDIDVTDIKIIE